MTAETNTTPTEPTHDLVQLRADLALVRRLTGTVDADCVPDYYPAMDRVFDFMADAIAMSPLEVLQDGIAQFREWVEENRPISCSLSEGHADKDSASILDMIDGFADSEDIPTLTAGLESVKAWVDTNRPIRANYVEPTDDADRLINMIDGIANPEVKR